MNSGEGLFLVMANTIAAIEEVFLTVWPIARYLLLFLLLSAFVGVHLWVNIHRRANYVQGTGKLRCSGTGNTSSEETGSERGFQNALGRNDMTASEEDYYEII